MTNISCHLCGRDVRRRPRTGKQRFPHKCPHGEWCVSGHRLAGKHANRADCPDCDDVLRAKAGLPPLDRTRHVRQAGNYGLGGS